ncbi:hypothetical protein BDN72DRAFT_906777 [Pluteus cervinus]|uniref:Uncharacterized protein n=1 Tax=Pluteus cervinus TaxID=181527 RepID=A0ACD2ZYD6_9AGAR|nr:hypothetical protein BDN72DRAFT_906777 [Pluteus cervinus]
MADALATRKQCEGCGDVFETRRRLHMHQSQTQNTACHAVYFGLNADDNVSNNANAIHDKFGTYPSSHPSSASCPVSRPTAAASASKRYPVNPLPSSSQSQHTQPLFLPDSEDEFEYPPQDDVSSPSPLQIFQGEPQEQSEDEDEPEEDNDNEPEEGFDADAAYRASVEHIWEPARPEMNDDMELDDDEERRGRDPVADEGDDEDEEAAQAADGGSGEIGDGGNPQNYVVDKYPDDAAGKPVPAPPGSGSANAGNDRENNPWAPFKNQVEWEIARWAKLRGPTSTAFSELLNIVGQGTPQTIIQ